MARNPPNRPPPILPKEVDMYDFARPSVKPPKNGKGFPRAADAAEFKFSKNVGLKQKS